MTSERKLPPLPPRPAQELLDQSPREVQDYVEAADAHLAEKLRELREAKRQVHPFRRKKNDRKKDEKKTARNKPGRKPGHARDSRAEPEHVDEEAHAGVPDTCPKCAGGIEETSTYVQLQEDVVINVVVRRIIVHVGKCNCCGAQVEGRHPFQTSTARGAAGHQLGPNVLALATVLHYRQGVPFEGIAQIFRQLGLQVCSSTLVRACARIADRADPAFQQLLAQVLREDVLHIDETGWAVGSDKGYLWVLTGSKTTVYFVRETRSGDEIADFLKDFAGVFVTDGHGGYDELGQKLLRALCLLHLRRNMQSLEDKTKTRAKVLAREMKRWLDDAIAFVGMRDSLSEAEQSQVAAELEEEFLKFIEARPANPANARMIVRLVRWQDAILRCIRDPRVPATNNRAERQIRPAVVLRKRGGCNKTERGARTFERLASILETRRQQGLSLIDWVVQVLTSPTPTPLLA